MLQKEYVYQEYVRREENLFRAPYNPELEFYSVIKSGDIEKTKELCQIPFHEKIGLGSLSDNELNNRRYHLVITIAMLARYCIEGGLDLATSFNLSDFYIKKADKAISLSQIDELHNLACMDYAKRMKKLNRNKITSKQIARCIDYISDHLHLKITLTMLADYVELNPSYLSRLFKEQTGQSVSDYIQSMKIDTAQNMLIYSDYSPADIANILAFPDQSYFTKVFRLATGVTPKKYQSMHLRETQIDKGHKNMNL